MGSNRLIFIIGGAVVALAIASVGGGSPGARPAR